MEYPKYTRRYRHYSWKAFEQQNPDVDSNYPFKDEEPKQPKKLDVWFVDNIITKVTIGQFDEAKHAYMLADELNKEEGRRSFCVRHYHPTPEQRDSELAEGRHNRRLNY